MKIEENSPNLLRLVQGPLPAGYWLAGATMALLGLAWLTGGMLGNGLFLAALLLAGSGIWTLGTYGLTLDEAEWQGTVENCRLFIAHRETLSLSLILRAELDVKTETVRDWTVDPDLPMSRRERPTVRRIRTAVLVLSDGRKVAFGAKLPGGEPPESTVAVVNGWLTALRDRRPG